MRMSLIAEFYRKEATYYRKEAESRPPRLVITKLEKKGAK